MAFILTDIDDLRFLDGEEFDTVDEAELAMVHEQMTNTKISKDRIEDFDIGILEMLRCATPIVYIVDSETKEVKKTLNNITLMRTGIISTLFPANQISNYRHSNNYRVFLEISIPKSKKERMDEICEQINKRLFMNIESLGKNDMTYHLELNDNNDQLVFLKLQMPSGCKIMSITDTKYWEDKFKKYEKYFGFSLRGEIYSII